MDTAEIIINILIGLFTLYAYASVFVIGYSVLKKRNLNTYPIPKKLPILGHGFWFFGLFLFLDFFLVGAYENIFFFIPLSWGHYIDSETFRSAKGSLVSVFSIVSAVLITGLLAQYHRKHVGYREKDIS
jgi:ethanolamine transporter EutH